MTTEKDNLFDLAIFATIGELSQGDLSPKREVLILASLLYLFTKAVKRREGEL